MFFVERTNKREKAFRAIAMKTERFGGNVKFPSITSVTIFPCDMRLSSILSACERK